MVGVEHYEELGVPPTASAAEIRSSYLALARRYHPDRLTSDSDAERALAAAKMARINAAWTVLSDRELRARYDASHGAESHPGATVRDVGNTWVPFDDGEDFEPDLFDDTPTGAPTLRRGLTFLPAGLVGAGVLSLVFGFAIGLGPLAAIGLLLLVAGGLAFLAIPLIALAKSSQADRL